MTSHRYFLRETPVSLRPKFSDGGGDELEHYCIFHFSFTFNDERLAMIFAFAEITFLNQNS